MIIIADLPDLPPSLETLFLLGNRFEEVPTSVSRLPALRMLSFKDCRLRRIGVPLPASLKWLILTGACDSATSPRSRAARHGNHTLRCLLLSADGNITAVHTSINQHHPRPYVHVLSCPTHSLTPMPTLSSSLGCFSLLRIHSHAISKLTLHHSRSFRGAVLLRVALISQAIDWRACLRLLAD
jgi:hypothetical protein